MIIDGTGGSPLGGEDRGGDAPLRSSVSAKGGRIIHISVRGDSPLFAEVLADPATVAVIRRRIARRAVSSHTQRAGRVPYGESRSR